MRILVLGADGMLGHVAFATLRRRHDVLGTCRRDFAASPLAAVAPRASCLDQLDAADAPRFAAAITSSRPAVIVNCIGLVRQRAGADDPQQQIRVNALWPHQLAAIADSIGARLVQIGTDCVFSGARGSYTPADIPDPTDLYGRCKLLGEVTRAPHLTLRTSLVGRQLAGSHGLVEWLLAQPPGPVPGYVHAVFSGLTTTAFAEVLELVLERRPDLHGLHHVAAAPISKHDLLGRLQRRLALPVQIVPEPRVRCDRSLDGSAFAAATGIVVPGWDEMLERLASEVPRYEPWRRCA